MNRTRHCFATVLVMWAVVLAAVLLAGVQRAAWRSAAAGRESVARTRAYWAARAGVEATIAQLAFNTTNPDLTSAFTVEDDMASVARGTLRTSASDRGATWSIEHSQGPSILDGPVDEHSKLNINTLTAEDLTLLPNMDVSIIDAILDWIDEDEDTRPFGAELGQYLSLKHPYEPRNAPIRFLDELELVRGVYPEFVRGEDWNLNSRLDPNEDDGALTFPIDDADGILDAEWSAHFTARSSRLASGEISASGQERIDLTVADATEVQNRLRIDATQAEAIVAYVQSTPTATLADFIRRELSQMSTGGGGGGGFAARRPTNLTTAELAMLLDECEIPVSGAIGPIPGKININTATRETLEFLASIDPGLLDAILLERNARSQGFASVVDILNVPSVTREVLATLYPIFDVRSNVYTVVSRGRDAATGVEVEISATLDRSALPITITDLTIR